MQLQYSTRECNQTFKIDILGIVLFSWEKFKLKIHWAKIKFTIDWMHMHLALNMFFHLQSVFDTLLFNPESTILAFIGSQLMHNF